MLTHSSGIMLFQTFKVTFLLFFLKIHKAYLLLSGKLLIYNKLILNRHMFGTVSQGAATSILLLPKKKPKQNKLVNSIFI